MLRYELDKLGWFEFESLIQSLLKAQLGMGVEAWGGSKDWGRDAYYEGSLRYPDNEDNAGVFLFQCKFVDGANAAGAKPKPLIKNAILGECSEIKKRRWDKAPSFYIFFTNARLTPSLRKEINSIISNTLPNTNVFCHDGRDICAWLDSTPQIVRAFPQLLGLRNLEDLLKNRVNADILTRSEAALTEAEKLRSVFVPTETYHQAIKTLSKFYFVILEGSPEMGKTAIGRMISLTQISQGWAAIEIREPTDFLREYSREEKQVFLADDFFGRTEYDPSRVERWQNELPNIFHKLDASHWLIFTSRLHLLNITKEMLDISGLNDKFPAMGEVVVDAQNLTIEEKARILYRHAKSANLDSQTKSMVRAQAKDITSNEYFTPERIRRLVQDWLRNGTEAKVKALSWQELSTLTRLNLKDPTKAMLVTFSRLPPAHKWFLFALVEQETSQNPWLDELQKRYELICPESDKKAFGIVVRELNEAFVRQVNKFSKLAVNWIHPSWRDLVIDELARNESLRRRYLVSCGPGGIQLATSIGGGARGTRRFPLLIDEKDWRICYKRGGELLEEGEDILGIILKNYLVMLSEKKRVLNFQIPEMFNSLLFKEMLGKVLVLSSEGRYCWTIPKLRQFYQARELSPSYIPTVDSTQLLASILAKTQSAIASNYYLNPSSCEDFESLIEILDEHDPAILRNPKFVDSISEVMGRLNELGDAEANVPVESIINDSIEDIESRISKLQKLSNIFESLAKVKCISDELSEGFVEIEKALTRQVWGLEDEVKRIQDESPEPDEYDYIRNESLGSNFDVDKLFRDL